MSYNNSLYFTVFHHHLGGMMMKGRNYQAGTSSYRYSINGQEVEFDLNKNITSALYWEYDSRIGRRWNVDPLTSHHKQIGLSPYNAFSNNPIQYFDPKGMIWEDPKDAKRLNKFINDRIESINKDNTEIQAQIDKGGLSEKKLAKLQDKLNNNSSKIENLNQSLADVKSIGEAKETYRLTGPSQTNGTHRVIKGSDGSINIEGSSTGLHIHEIRHIGQSIESGGVKFNSSGELLNAASVINGDYSKIYNNEINAYQVQYSFDGSYPGGASSLKDINTKSLRDLKDDDGNYTYRYDENK